MIKIRVPARICFFGDHQDYLGLPVIAGTIDRYMQLKAKPIRSHEFQLELKDINSFRTVPLDTNGEKVAPGDYIRSAMAILLEKDFRFRQGYKIEISGNIPINAGLSSSSALTVAWIRFLVAIQEGRIRFTDSDIGRWAYEAEVRFFDQPGGLMDQYTIAQQGLLFIDTQHGKTERLKGRWGNLVIAESGMAKRTLDVLQNAKSYQQSALYRIKAQNPEFKIQDANVMDYEKYKGVIPEKYVRYWYATIHNYDITQKAKRLLKNENPDLMQLGELMNRHQKILEDHIGNTPREMAMMMDAARKAGANGTKIIGSGGGGCMVAMVEDTHKQDVITAFLDNGAKAAYEVKLTYPKV
ncbi:GHMP kinase [Muricauda sp. SCSIO 64092]|uniref:mevalonate kinase family protein n=1 Tax=Allomuricauda sp. SCSIO 64092 TaxID=2908842 RepID=UPI001FF5A5E9|nr:GHMP kinase [Muricauda sp. SCSIO 64092]UOY07463.1 GHMP kinase [Muricauda sp. SCSIO 64092]